MQYVNRQLTSKAAFIVQNRFNFLPVSNRQCDEKKNVAKCQQKLPKNDFTRKLKILTSLQKNCLRMWAIRAN